MKSEPTVPTTVQRVERGKRPWQHGSVRFAIVITVLGLAMWVYSAVSGAKRDEASPPPTSSLPAAPHSSAFGGNPSAPQPAAAEKTESRVVDSAAPATFRFGASFLGGFGLAWLMKKFVKLSLLVAGLAAVAIYGLYKLGVINPQQSDEIQHQLEAGIDVAKTHAGRIKDFLTGYLPSGLSAFAGMFVGFRKA